MLGKAFLFPSFFSLMRYKLIIDGLLQRWRPLSLSTPSLPSPFMATSYTHTQCYSSIFIYLLGPPDISYLTSSSYYTVRHGSGFHCTSPPGPQQRYLKGR